MFTAGLALFLFIITMAFWMLIFLAGFALPYAITVYIIHKLKPAVKEEEVAQTED